MPLFPWRQHIFPPHRQVMNRILVVADGKLDFCDDTEFGLAELSSMLRDTRNPWDEIKVTTAHRFDSPCKCADIPGFEFDKPPHEPHLPFSIENYDQLWLFGDLDSRGKAIRSEEVDKIIEFMNEGGGVFATGDHQDLGIALCGEIPRVRTMRMWKFPPAPDRDGPTRLDTLRQGTAKGFMSTDQSDGTPQEIRPRFTLDSGGKKNSFAHPLLRKGDFAVTVLPDHMHEGECKLPTIEELNARYFVYGKTDWGREYAPSGDGSQVKPEVVAISTSAGGFLVDEGDVEPVEPRAFTIIVAYDGHRVQPLPFGRVAVDSSFHHFVNINLKGSGESGHTGFFDAQHNPTEHGESIMQYFRNIASWLKPPNKQRPYYLNVLVALRYLSPLLEEVTSNSPYSEREILFIGTSTRSAIAQRLSSVDSVLCSLAITEMLAEPTQSILRELIDPWRDSSLNRSRDATSAIDRDLFVRFALGTAMISIARSLPDDPCEAGSGIDKLENRGEKIETVLKRELPKGMSVLNQIINQTTRTLNVEKLTMQNGSNRSHLSEIAAEKEEEIMASKCSGKWKSVRTKASSVKTEHVKVDDDGKHGHHQEKSLDVMVDCLADGMTWDMDDGSTHFHYSGDFDGEKHGLPHEDHVHGTCTISFVIEGRKDSKRPDDMEEWNGTKTT